MRAFLLIRKQQSIKRENLISLYEAQGVTKDRVLNRNFSSTWEGIQERARNLKKKASPAI